MIYMERSCSWVGKLVLLKQQISFKKEFSHVVKKNLKGFVKVTYESQIAKTEEDR